MPPDLVVLGNLIVDDIVYDDGSTCMAQPGGAALYMALTAHLWSLPIGIVSRMGSDYPTSMLDSMSRLGASLDGVATLDGSGLRTWLLYEGDVRRVVHRLTGASHRQASPDVADIPSEWRPRAVHLAPMPFELQRRQVADLRRRFGSELLISLDPFELVVDRELERWHDLLAEVDLFFFSEDEIPSAAIRRAPEPLLERLQSRGTTTVLYKQGARGGLFGRGRSGPRGRWPALAERVIDTTGAGDAFACGVLAGILAGEPIERAVGYGVVSASFAIENRGSAGLLEGRSEVARRRLTEWFSEVGPTRPGSVAR